VSLSRDLVTFGATVESDSLQKLSIEPLNINDAKIKIKLINTNLLIKRIDSFK